MAHSTCTRELFRGATQGPEILLHSYFSINEKRVSQNTGSFAVSWRNERRNTDTSGYTDRAARTPTHGRRRWYPTRWLACRPPRGKHPKSSRTSRLSRSTLAAHLSNSDTTAGERQERAALGRRLCEPTTTHFLPATASSRAEDSLRAKVLVGVDLVTQVQHAVNIADHGGQPVPQAQLLYVGVAVAAHAGVCRGCVEVQRERA